MKIITKAEFFLLIVTALWGLTFPILKITLQHIDAYTFVAARFILASLVLLPIAYHHRKKLPKNFLFASLMLGIFNTLIYLLQLLSLNYISASRCAFITGINVVLVPLLAPVFKLGKISVIDLLCAVLTLFGLYILTGADLNNIGFGDLLVFIAAMVVAIYILYLQKLSTLKPEPLLLSFYQFLFTIPAPLILSFQYNNFKMLLNPTILLALLYCSLLATIVVFYLQTKYQRYTTVTKAALIFALEPIFACIAATLLIAEPMTRQILMGGGIMISSIVLIEYWKLRHIK